MRPPAVRRCAATSSPCPPDGPGRNADPFCICPRIGPGPSNGTNSGPPPIPPPQLDAITADRPRPEQGRLGRPADLRCPPHPARSNSKERSFSRSVGGSGAGAVALPGGRSRSRGDRSVSRRVVLLRGRGQVAPFPTPARQSVHAVLPHTAYRRRSPPAFGLSRQSRKGLGAATVPVSPTSPSWFGDWKNTTERPQPRRRWCRLATTIVSRSRA
jgi:hypothetical protein